MTKVLLVIQVVASSLIHLFCCGLPLLLSISGSLGILMFVQTYKPVLFVVQFLVFGFTFYQLYKPSVQVKINIRKYRIAFWLIMLISFILFFYPPKHWFKSEETQLKQAQIKRFFKHKTR